MEEADVMLNIQTPKQFSLGYTLIEILIVLTVMTTLFGLGYASFRNFSRRQAFSAVATQIKSDLRLAQAQSLSGKKLTGCGTNILKSISFSLNGSSAYDIKQKCADSTEVLIKTVSIDSIYTLALTSPSVIEFLILGRGTNISPTTPAVITISDARNNLSREVTVNSSGEIH